MRVMAKTTHDPNHTAYQGIVVILREEGLMGIVKSNWHDGWKAAHKDHPRYSKCPRFPYAIRRKGGAQSDKDKEEATLAEHTNK